MMVPSHKSIEQTIVHLKQMITMMITLTSDILNKLAPIQQKTKLQS